MIPDYIGTRRWGTESPKGKVTMNVGRQIEALRNAAHEIALPGGASTTQRRKLSPRHVDAAFEKTRREMEIEVLQRFSTN
jgi:hypothetical protein